jgi:uncharacterized protein (DUF305 family)
VYPWQVKNTCIPVVLFIAAAGLGCKSAGTAPATAGGTQIIRPGAPGQDSKPVTAAQATDLSKVQFSPADAKFMQGMIGHHSQAVEMVELLKQNTQWDDMKKLGMRIQVSQEDEIKMMQEWLKGHGQEIPGPHAHHMPGGMMPGMLSDEEMAKLAAAKGNAFDKLFLEGMIKHHSGAIIMVEELFATPGAAQDGGIFAFASDVVSDQRMEMERMSAMLNTVKERMK